MSACSLSEIQPLSITSRNPKRIFLEVRYRLGPRVVLGEKCVPSWILTATSSKEATSHDDGRRPSGVCFQAASVITKLLKHLVEVAAHVRASFLASGERDSVRLVSTLQRVAADRTG